MVSAGRDHLSPNWRFDPGPLASSSQGVVGTLVGLSRMVSGVTRVMMSLVSGGWQRYRHSGHQRALIVRLHWSCTRKVCVSCITLAKIYGDAQKRLHYFELSEVVCLKEAGPLAPVAVLLRRRGDDLAKIQSGPDVVVMLGVIKAYCKL